MLTPDAIGILSQAYINIGNFALSIARGDEDGLDGTLELEDLYDRGVKATVIYDEIIRQLLISPDGLHILAIRSTATDVELNTLLFYLRDVALVTDLPILPKPLVVYNVNLYAGAPGPPGANGANAYLYIGYANDSSGTNFSNAPDITRLYIGIRQSNVPLTYDASLFSGIWFQYRGNDGAPGTPGTNGVNNYIFQAWASDASGTNFTLSFNAAFKYTAFLVKNVNVPPLVAEFAGLWTKYVGDNGTNGTNGVNGKTVLSGTIDPSNGQGSDGDFYINYGGDPWLIFGPKAAGVWPAGVNIKGNIGDTGPPGTDGNDGAPGADGQSYFFYIAWADDAAGTGFTNVFDPNKNWIATKRSLTEIVTPVVGDFAGLWAKYRGDGDRWTTTSSTTLTIGLGSKSFIVENSLAYSTGQRVVISTPFDPNNRMEGLCGGYDQVTGQLTVIVDAIFGSGTFSTWDVSLQGAPANIITTAGDFATLATDQGSGGSTQATSTSFVKINAFDTIVSQSGGVSASTATDDITIGNGGAYNIAFQGVISGTALSDFTFQLFKNGVAVPNAITRVLLDAAGSPQNVNIGPISFSGIAASDVFDIRIKAGTGTPNVLVEQGSFTVSTVGATNIPEDFKFDVTPIDIGTTYVDLIPIGTVTSVVWELSILKASNVKTQVLVVGTDGSVVNTSIIGVVSLGTVDITFTVDISGGNLRLGAVATSNGWEVAGIRRIIK